MTRRTIKIDELKAEANKVFRESTNDYADGRRHIQSFVETILMNTRQYKGFRYLSPDESVATNKPGIIFDKSGKGYHKFPDHTRIAFY